MAKLDERHTSTATMIAAEAITKGYAVKLTTTQNVAELSDAQGEAIDGVAGESCAAGAPFLVIKDGEVKAVAQEAITINQQVTPDGTGKFEVAASGDVIYGKARTAAAADGDEFIIEIMRGKTVV